MIVLLAWVATAAEPWAHPELTWTTLSTEHFRIHYPQAREGRGPPVDAEGTAHALARVADTLWLRMGDQLGFHPLETIDIVVRDDADTLEGYTIPQWDLIVVSAHPGPDLWRIRGRQAWGPDVLAHELGHLFAHKQAASLAERASLGLEVGVMGESGPLSAAATLHLPPHEATWWSEGGAELLSEQVGVGWWTTSRDMTLRASVLDDRLLTWDQLQVAGDKRDFADGERTYQQGYAFLRWLGARYGDDILQRVGHEASRRYPLRWDGALGRVTGVPAAELYALHLDAIATHYRAQAEAIATTRGGVVEGVELLAATSAWADPDLTTSDAFVGRRRRDRETTREGTGVWNLHPQVSPDGRWFAEGRGGWLRVAPHHEALWPLRGDLPASSQVQHLRDDQWARSTWLPAQTGHGFAFVPGADAVVVVADADADHPSPRRPAMGGYGFTRLFVVDLGPEPHEVRHRGGTEEEARLAIGDSARAIKERYRPIRGTLRAHDPAVSTKGQLAFVQVRDGTANLVVAELDGGGRRELTHFEDGTWLQGPSWSPDGRYLVVSVHRNHQSNLWQVDTHTGRMQALTWDPWEERDPHWAHDGGIYFAADPEGVFDVFRLDPEEADGERAVRRITRVLTGAATPSLAPSGTLLYSRYSAFGWKSMGIVRERQAWEATRAFRLRPGAAASAADLATEPPPRTGEARPYGAHRNLMVPAGGPLVRMDITPWGAEPRVGGTLRISDVLQEHVLAGAVLVGEDILAQGSYRTTRLRPALELWGVHEDARRTTPGVIDTIDRRRAGRIGLTVTWPWNEVLRAIGETQLVTAAVPAQPAGRPEPFLASWRTSGALEVGDPEGLRRIDARGALVRVGLTHRWSDLHRPELDDGDRLDRVSASQVQWVVRSLAPPSRALPHHRVEVGWTLIGTDHNLHRIEEPRAGGDHPYALRLGALEPTFAFPGYAPWSLSGENVAIATLGYTLPLVRRAERRWGPLTLDELRLRLAGDAGNLWSWHAGRMEVPLVDAPSDHGLPLLVDGVVELRLASYLFDAAYDSFVRLAWAPVAPLRSADARDGAVPELLAAPPGGPRVMVGLGTGW